MAACWVSKVPLTREAPALRILHPLPWGTTCRLCLAIWYPRRLSFQRECSAPAKVAREAPTCRCLQSSVAVLAIERRFLLTLNETGDALVLALSETGLTFAET